MPVLFQGQFLVSFLPVTRTFFLVSLHALSFLLENKLPEYFTVATVEIIIFCLFEPVSLFDGVAVCLLVTLLNSSSNVCVICHKRPLVSLFTS